MADLFKSTEINVCIATYRRPRLLRDCLQSLAAQSRTKEFLVNIHVCDNDSMQSAKSVIDEMRCLYPLVSIAYSCMRVRNISLAKNMAIASGQGEYIALIDDDNVVHPNWLSQLLMKMRHHPNQILKSKVLSYSDLGKLPTSRNYHESAEENGRPLITTSAQGIFMSRKTFAKIGPFDPNYGLSGCGDVDFFMRAFTLGYSIWSCPGALLWEYHGTIRTRVRYAIKRSFCSGAVMTHLLLSHGWLAGSATARKRHFSGLTNSLVRLPFRVLKKMGGKGAFVNSLRPIAHHLGALFYLGSGKVPRLYARPILYPDQPISL